MLLSAQAPGHPDLLSYIGAGYCVPALLSQCLHGASPPGSAVLAQGTAAARRTAGTSAGQGMLYNWKRSSNTHKYFSAKTGWVFLASKSRDMCNHVHAISVFYAV